MGAGRAVVEGVVGLFTARESLGAFRVDVEGAGVGAAAAGLAAVTSLFFLLFPPSRLGPARPQGGRGAAGAAMVSGSEGVSEMVLVKTSSFSPKSESGEGASSKSKELPSSDDSVMGGSCSGVHC